MLFMKTKLTIFLKVQKDSMHFVAFHACLGQFKEEVWIVSNLNLVPCLIMFYLWVSCWCHYGIERIIMQM